MTLNNSQPLLLPFSLPSSQADLEIIKSSTALLTTQWSDKGNHSNLNWEEDENELENLWIATTKTTKTTTEWILRHSPRNDLEETTHTKFLIAHPFGIFGMENYWMLYANWHVNLPNERREHRISGKFANLPLSGTCLTPTHTLAPCTISISSVLSNRQEALRAVPWSKRHYSTLSFFRAVHWKCKFHFLLRSLTSQYRNWVERDLLGNE